MPKILNKTHQGRNHAVKVGGSGWATDGARVEEGVGTVVVAAPGF